jgi:hypothetical protein
MKTLTVSNLHGYHIGQSQPSEVVASLRSYVTLSIGDVSERTSLSADESTYPMWHDKLNLRLPERQEDGVLTVRPVVHRIIGQACRKCRLSFQDEASTLWSLTTSEISFCFV